MTDQEILTGLRQNDRRTIEYVYKTLGPPIFKYVLSNSGTRQDAEDLFPETFMKVLKKIQDGQYNDNNQFEAYFIIVARNTWIDHLRKIKGNYRVGDDDELLKLADDSDEEALMQLILHDRRLEALSVVWASWQDTDCLRILDAFHYKCTSTKDIANTEGEVQNTILQRLRRCRNKLFVLVSQEIGNRTK